MFQQQLDYYTYESILTYRYCGGLLPYYSKTAHVQVKEEVTLAAMKKGTSPLALFFCDPVLNVYYIDSELRYAVPLREKTSHESILRETRNLWTT